MKRYRLPAYGPDSVGAHVEAIIQDRTGKVCMTFDWAVPYDLFRQVCDVAGLNVSGRVVTAYLDGLVFGMVTGLDDESGEWVNRALNNTGEVTS